MIYDTTATLSPWTSNPLAQRAAEQLGQSADVIETAIRIQQIAAPTFSEGARAQAVRQLMLEYGLADVDVDALGNVYGRVPGREPQGGLLIAAHMDTVFPAATDLAIRREGQRIYGPGLGDNSLGVAALLHLGKALIAQQIVPAHDLWLVADVGEEGLGDLRGMRAAVGRLRGSIRRAIALEGTGHDRIVHEAIGVRRYRITAKAPGGHSWQNFGAPSAIHSLVRLAERLTHLELPKAHSSYNIGVIEGGTSINAIAEHASLLLDLRSVESDALGHLIRQAERMVATAQAAEPQVAISAEVVGDRPAGRIGHDHPLVRLAQAAYKAVGTTTSSGVGSTDANIPLSMGIPAVCIGVTDGANAHRLDEYIETTRVGQGMRALLWLALAAS